MSKTTERYQAGFQDRLDAWMVECFGREVANDIAQRNHRFFEEAAEMIQSTGATREEAHLLVDYVFDRPAGIPHQEAGGVMLTLGALLNALGLDMNASAEMELDRVSQPATIEKIRAKQATKPHSSPLPGKSVGNPSPVTNMVVNWLPAEEAPRGIRALIRYRSGLIDVVYKTNNGEPFLETWRYAGTARGGEQAPWPESYIPIGELYRLPESTEGSDNG